MKPVLAATSNRSSVTNIHPLRIDIVFGSNSAGQITPQSRFEASLHGEQHIEGHGFTGHSVARADGLHGLGLSVVKHRPQYFVAEEVPVCMLAALLAFSLYLRQRAIEKIGLPGIGKAVLGAALKNRLGQLRWMAHIKGDEFLFGDMPLSGLSAHPVDEKLIQGMQQE